MCIVRQQEFDVALHERRCTNNFVLQDDAIALFRLEN